MRKIFFRFPEFLCKRVLFYAFHLLYLYFILPNMIRAMKVYLALYRRVNALYIKIFISKKLNYLHTIKSEILNNGERGYKRKIDDLGLTKDNLELLKLAQQRSHEIVIAKIDQDGYYYSYFGPIKDIQTVSKDNFLNRKKFNLEVVAINEYLGVKKYFNKDKISFFHEIEALHALGKSGCNIPAILDVDFEKLTLTISLILGCVLREKLAKNGAVLRDCDVNNNPDFVCLTEYESAIKRINEGKRILYNVVDRQFIENLFIELQKIHSNSFLLDDIKYGNIVIERESNQPYLIDFDHARNYSKLNNNVFSLYRDLDIEKFNLHFGTDKLTYNRIKERIKTKKIDSNLINNFPIYFGAGVRIGPIWKLDSGYGNWHYLLTKYLPLFSEKCILTVLSNNAFYSLQLLREGAMKIVGVEIEEENIKDKSFLQEGYEWADNKKYNYQKIDADLCEISKFEFNKFDVLITQYPLYYQGADFFSTIVQYAYKVTDRLVVMSNNNTDRNQAYHVQKKFFKHAASIIENNGFSIIQDSSPQICGCSPIIAEKNRN